MFEKCSKKSVYTSCSLRVRSEFKSLEKYKTGFIWFLVTAFNYKIIWMFKSIFNRNFSFTNPFEKTPVILLVHLDTVKFSCSLKI